MRLAIIGLAAGILHLGRRRAPGARTAASPDEEGEDSLRHMKIAARINKIVTVAISQAFWGFAIAGRRSQFGNRCGNNDFGERLFLIGPRWGICRARYRFHNVQEWWAKPRLGQNGRRGKRGFDSRGCRWQGIHLGRQPQGHRLGNVRTKPSTWEAPNAQGREENTSITPRTEPSASNRSGTAASDERCKPLAAPGPTLYGRSLRRCKASANGWRSFQVKPGIWFQGRSYRRSIARTGSPLDAIGVLDRECGSVGPSSGAGRFDGVLQ